MYIYIYIYYSALPLGALPVYEDSGCKASAGL